MAGRRRYPEGAPVTITRAANGADPEEPRYTTGIAARMLGIPSVTLFRWWQAIKFPDAAPDTDAADPYEPDQQTKGGQLTLLWPASVVERIRLLLEATASLAGIPGAARLPPKPGSAGIRGGQNYRYEQARAAKQAIKERATDHESVNER